PPRTGNPRPHRGRGQEPGRLGIDRRRRCDRPHLPAGNPRLLQSRKDVGLGLVRRRGGVAVRVPAIRFHLLAVGRLRRGPLCELQKLYAARLVPRATIIELEEKRPLPPALLKAREAELILGALPAGARLVALDPGGAAWSSRDLAERLANW